MKNPKNKPLMNSLILGFLLTLVAIELGSESEKQHLEWKPVDGAYAYKVEVRDQSKKVFFEKTIRTNKIDISLTTGSYEHRIGVMNKFSKIVGYSNWYPLNVLVSVPPIIETKGRISSKKGDSEFTFTLDGKNFFEETKIAIVSSSEKITVDKSEVLSDGKKIKISVNLSDAKPGVYDIIFENPKKKISRKAKFFIVQAGEKPNKEEQALLAEETKTEEIDNGIKESKEKTPDKINYQKSLWGALWRSAVLPGWGHIYGDEKTKGYIHMGLFFASVANVYTRRTEAIRQGKLLVDKEYEDFAGQIFPGLSSTYPLSAGLLLHQYHVSQYSHFKDRYNESLKIVGGLYLFQLFHSYYSARNFDRRMWSVLWRATILPGWGQLEAGNTKTGYTYLSLFAASLSNVLVKSEKLRIEKDSYKNNFNSAIGIGLGGNRNLAFIMEKNFHDTYHHAERNYHQSLNILAAVYGIQLLHSFYSGHAYEKTNTAEYIPGKITPAGLMFSAVPSIQANRNLPNDAKLDYNMQMLFTF